MKRLSVLARRMGSRSSFVRLVVVTALIFLTFSAINPAVFLSGKNFQYIAMAGPELAILSLAISVAMLTAGIDLSVVAIANLSAIIAARVMITMGDNAISVIVGVTTAILVSLGCGLINGVLVSRFNVPAILATLGTSQLFGGLALVTTGGTVMKGLPSSFTSIALLTFAGIPVVFWIMLIITVVVGIVITKSALGFRMRLVGANPRAADFSGIRRIRVLTQTYLLSALLAGAAGLIISARASGANSQYGSSYVLLGIVVAVLAGVDPDGGYLTVPGVIIATFALVMLGAGMNSVGISSHLVTIAQGLLLVVMVALNAWSDQITDRIKLLRHRPAKETAS